MVKHGFSKNIYIEVKVKNMPRIARGVTTNE